MQGFRNYPMDNQQRDQQIVVDLMPSQYTKPTTPPPSPPLNGKFCNILLLSNESRKVFIFDGPSAIVKFHIIRRHFMCQLTHLSAPRSPMLFLGTTYYCSAGPSNWRTASQISKWHSLSEWVSQHRKSVYR